MTRRSILAAAGAVIASTLAKCSLASAGKDTAAQKEGRLTLMYKLTCLGVTHFVVDDKLKDEFLRFEHSEPLTFRGHRILFQDDLRHLPFDANPSISPKDQRATDYKFTGVNP